MGRAKYYHCGQFGHMQWDFPSRVAFWANRASIAIFPTPVPKSVMSISGFGTSTGRSHLCAIFPHQGFEASLNNEMGMLRLFSHDGYYFFYPRSTFLMWPRKWLCILIVLPRAYQMFFFISTLVADSMTITKVYRRCVVFVGGSDTFVDFVEWYMVELMSSKK